MKLAKKEAIMLKENCVMCGMQFQYGELEEWKWLGHYSFRLCNTCSRIIHGIIINRKLEREENERSDS